MGEGGTDRVEGLSECVTDGASERVSERVIEGRGGGGGGASGLVGG